MQSNEPERRVLNLPLAKTVESNGIKRLRANSVKLRRRNERKLFFRLNIEMGWNHSNH